MSDLESWKGMLARAGISFEEETVGGEVEVSFDGPFPPALDEGKLLVTFVFSSSGELDCVY